MAQCTHMHLRIARDAQKMPRWRAASLLGVSEWTVQRWESGQVRPQPDDVERMERIYDVPGLWHSWMRSHYDSYRRRYPDDKVVQFPASVVNVRHQINDVLSYQDRLQRDVLDGKVDDKDVSSRYYTQLSELAAAALRAMSDLQHRR